MHDSNNRSNDDSDHFFSQSLFSQMLMEGAAQRTDSFTHLSLLPNYNEVQAKKQIHCKLYKRFGAKMKLLKTTSVKMV